MNVQFIFGAKNSKQKTPQNINIRVYHNHLDFRGSLNIEIQPIEWDFKNRRIIDITKGARTHERSSYLQKIISTLNNLEESFSSGFLELKLGTNLKTLPKENWNAWCKDILELGLGRKSINIEPSNNLISRMKGYLDAHKLTFEKNTIKGHKTVIGVLECFMDYQKLFEQNPKEASIKKIKTWYFNKYGSSLKKQFDCTELDIEFFYTSLQDWMHLRGFKPNYFGTIIQKIKAVVRYYESTDDSFKFHQNIKNKAFAVIQESPEHDILTEEEIEAIENFIGAKYLENARDLMIIQYYACLRFNELQAETLKGYERLKLRKTIKDGEASLLWEIFQPKTNATKVIGVHSKLEHILKNRFPKSISSQKYNTYLKELSDSIGIQNKRITSHTIRRSFCTNMYNRNHLIQDIMQYSGHDNEDKFRLYVKQKNVNRDNAIPLK
jgi:integrase